MFLRCIKDRRGQARITGVVILIVIIVVVVVAWRMARQRAARPYVLGAASASQQDIAQAAARAMPAVVRIDTSVGGGPAGALGGLFGGQEGIFPRHGIGSGMIINGGRGYVLTNAHVAAGARSIQVTLPDGRAFKGKPLGADALTDVAVVQIRGRRLPEVKLGSSDRLAVGSWVIAVGSPLGLQNTVTAGVLSAKGRIITGENGVTVADLLQTDAPINGGNSGGALVDLQGQVVGMPTAIVPFAQGIGFAVAIDTAKRVIPALARGEKVRHAWLGIEYTTNPSGPGAVVERVLSGSPAAAAGLRRGDVITVLNGRRVRGSDDLANIISPMLPGEKLGMTIERGRQEKQITVRLGEMSQRG